MTVRHDDNDDDYNDDDYNDDNNDNDNDDNDNGPACYVNMTFFIFDSIVCMG